MAGLRRQLGRVRDRALAPIVVRLDHLQETLDSNSTRLDGLSARVSDIETVLHTIEGRAATVSERQAAGEDSQARLTQRLDHIEKLLAEG
jgi:outer membrane murein-binding lipoprotein Lpp